MFKAILSMAVALPLSACFLTTENITRDSLLPLDGDNPPIDDLTDYAARSSQPIQSWGVPNPDQPLNQFVLTRDLQDGWISWTAPDGNLYSLDPAAVRANYWGLIKDQSSPPKPVMGYYWNGRNDSYLALSLDGANSHSAMLANNTIIPDKLFYFGIGPGVPPTLNPLKRPAIFIRAVGRRNDAPIARGEHLDVVTVAADKQETYVAGPIQNKIDALDLKVGTFVRNLEARTFNVIQTENDPNSQDWKWMDEFSGLNGCSSTADFADKVCPGQAFHAEAIWDKTGGVCGTTHWVLTCTEKPYLAGH